MPFLVRAVVQGGEKLNRCRCRVGSTCITSGVAGWRARPIRRWVVEAALIGPITRTTVAPS